MRHRAVVFFLALIISSAGTWGGEYINPKVSPARQKENDWVMIERYKDLELTPEELFGEDNKMAKMDREVAQQTGRSVNRRLLFVTVHFLKPCKATTLYELMMKEGVDSPLGSKYGAIMMYLGVYGDLVKGGKENEAEKIKEKMEKKYPDLDQLVDEYYLFPKYDCSYKTKIKVTYYNASGREMKTENSYPIARGEEDGKRKLSLPPGETIGLQFFIPDGAERWDVWVSK